MGSRVPPRALIHSPNSRNEYGTRPEQVFAHWEDKKQFLTQKNRPAATVSLGLTSRLGKETHGAYTMATSRGGSSANTAWWQLSIRELIQGSVQKHTWRRARTQIPHLESINGPRWSVQEEREGRVLIKKSMTEATAKTRRRRRRSEPQGARLLHILYIEYSQHCWSIATLP